MWLQVGWWKLGFREFDLFHFSEKMFADVRQIL
jgi:hypothetical protein